MAKLLLFVLPWIALLPAATLVFADPRGQVHDVSGELAALLMGVVAVAAVVYVAGEDTYRHDGTTVWTAYQVGGRAIAAIASCVLAGGALGAASRSKVSEVLAFGLALLAAFLSWLLVIGTAN